MRVVLYAEGALEVRGAASRVPAPGETLLEPELGAAHRLVRRILCSASPSLEIGFVAPLRVRGRVAVGSDLQHPTTLRRLLTWPAISLAPDLAIVLVDGDGDANRRASLISTIEGLTTATVVGVCEHEFESWLVGDLAAVRQVSGRDVDEIPAPSNVDPGFAKHWLRSIIGGAGEAGRRESLSERCDLERLRRQRSFELFAKDLERHAQ